MLYRTILLLSLTWILITGIVLVLMVDLSWNNHERIAPLSRHMAYVAKLDAVRDSLDDRFVPAASINTEADRRYLADVISALEPLVLDESALSRDSGEFIGQAVTALRTVQEDVPETAPKGPPESLRLLRKALRIERHAHQALLEDLAVQGERQFHATMVLVVVIPIATGAFLVFFRRRVLAPLNDLGYLIGLLSRKDYAAAMTDDVDPLMAPLFEKYNRMVRRMRDLDQSHVKREDALQKDVEAATRALVAQQAALARAERMAAVGDLSARLAHDLRSPMSGVVVALSNLRDEVSATEHSERLDMVIRELERIARMLKNLVEESRQVPERPRRLQIKRVMDDLVKLLRYQLDPGISIEVRVPEEIYCRLPESGFRHSIMNLVTNAAQAIGKESGKIEVTASVKDGQVELAISDDGPGFPEELLTIGVHEHGSWRKGGTGLGLATVRRFALANETRLELSNRLEGGAQVVLRLPVDDCETEK